MKSFYVSKSNEILTNKISREDLIKFTVALDEYKDYYIRSYGSILQFFSLIGGFSILLLLIFDHFTQIFTFSFFQKIMVDENVNKTTQYSNF
jgi:hypothetical protein